MKKVSGKTLEQLENDDWGDPPYNSHLVTECHRLRRVPLGEFTTENLRIMIGQNIGLEYLLPFAMQIIRKNPMVSGDYYEGDLLCAVIGCDMIKSDMALRREVRSICEAALSRFRRDLRAETIDYFAGRDPTDFGLETGYVEVIVESRIELELRQHPWQEFVAFATSGN